VRSEYDKLYVYTLPLEPNPSKKPIPNDQEIVLKQMIPNIQDGRIVNGLIPSLRLRMEKTYLLSEMTIGFL
jgi:hypothetical protein